MCDLDRAKELLRETGVTLALVKGGRSFVSDRRGVQPLLELVQSGENVRGASAADRVVGKAAALLYVLLGVGAVYAEIISASAEEVLRGHGIAVEAQMRVERIQNRTKDGFCPMETAVLFIDDPHEAYLAVKAKSEELRRAK